MTEVPQPSIWSLRNWRLLWLSEGVSTVGDYVFRTTVILWIAISIDPDPLSGPLAVGGVTIATTVATLVAGPAAGVFVDRWNRKRVMMISDLLRAALIAIVLAIPMVGQHWPMAAKLTLIYAVIVLTSIVSAAASTAGFAVFAEAIPASYRARAFSLSQATMSTAAVIGPPLAAPLLFGVGPAWGLVVDVASFVISFALVRRVAVEPVQREAAEEPNFWRELAAGIRMMAGSRILFVTVVATAVFMFGASAFNVLDVYFVTDTLRAPAGWLGFLFAGFDLGSVVGALIAGWILARAKMLGVFSYGIVVAGVMLLGYALSTTFAGAMIFLTLAGLPLAVVNVAISPIMLEHTPEEFLGRIGSVFRTSTQAFSLVAMALTGYLASGPLSHFHVHRFGVQLDRVNVIFIGAALTVLASGVAALLLYQRPGPKRAETEGSATDQSPESEGAVA